MALATIKRTFQHAAAARAASQLRRADGATARLKAGRLLARRLGKLHGLPQKIGQLLSIADSSLGADAEFAALQDDVAPWHLDQLRPHLEETWQRPVNIVVRWIDPRGNAASIGQVHRAQLHDGRVVAIKMQYPGIRDALRTDLRMLGWIGASAGAGRRGFDLDAYRQALCSQLDAELDYRQEARCQADFCRWARNVSGIVIPEVVSEWSTDKVLVTQWVDGVAWPEVREEWSFDDRRRLAGSLLNLFVQGLFVHGSMQSDWHPGNVRCRRGPGGPEWVLYDFGNTCRLSPERRKVLARLLNTSCERSDTVWQLFVQLGFDAEKLSPLRHKLPALCKILFEPFQSPRSYELKSWRLGERLRDLLGDDRWNFRLAAPPDLLPLVRAFHGVIYYLDGLNVPVAAQQTLQSCLATLGPEMAAIPALSGDDNKASVSRVACWLKVRVRRAGQTIVQLTLPGDAVERLSTLLDDALLRRIREQSIDLDRLTAAIRQRGFTPGPVFELTDDDREIAVWLE